MEITVWEGFSKRSNSTLRPSGGTVLNVRLLDAQDIVSPSFVLKENGTKYNFLKWENRYYYITDITYLSRHRMVLSTSLDILATYKSNILNTTAYIQRASTGYNDLIPDSLVTNTNRVLASTNNVTASCFAENGSGYYVLTCMSKSVANTTGVATCWVVNSNSLKLISNWFCNGGVAKAFKELFEKPLDSIFSLKYIPFSSGVYSGKVGASTDIELGGITPVASKVVTDYSQPILDDDGMIIGYKVDVEATATLAGAVGSPFTSRSCPSYSYTISVPWATGIEPFMKNGPYTSINLFVPYYGYVQIDPLKLSNGGVLDLNFCLDPITGDVTLRIFGDASMPIGLYTYNCSVDVPIGDRDKSGILKSAIAAAGTAASAIMSGGSAVATAKAARNASFESAIGDYASYLNDLCNNPPDHASAKTALAMNQASDQAWARMQEAQGTYRNSVKAGVTNAVKGGVAGAVGSMLFVGPSTSTLGSCGGMSLAQLGNVVRCTAMTQSFLPIDYAAVAGRPVCQTESVGSHSGYVQTIGASVASPMFSAELGEALDGGVYIE